MEVIYSFFIMSIAEEKWFLYLKLKEAIASNGTLGRDKLEQIRDAMAILKDVETMAPEGADDAYRFLPRHMREKFLK